MGGSQREVSDVVVREKFEIEFEVPNSVKRMELRNFITEALELSGGCRHRNDHLFLGLRKLRLKALTPNTPVSKAKQNAYRSQLATAME